LTEELALFRRLRDTFTRKRPMLEPLGPTPIEGALYRPH